MAKHTTQNGERNPHADETPHARVQVFDPGGRSRCLTVYGTDLDTVYAEILQQQRVEKRRILAVRGRVVLPPDSRDVMESEASADESESAA